MEETGIAHYYRDMKIVGIYDGAAGVQAVDIVGREIDSRGRHRVNHG